jgi:hypothetical protein
MRSPPHYSSHKLIHALHHLVKLLFLAKGLT